MLTIEYTALGNGLYRILGPRFIAEVHCYHDSGGGFHCIVDSCNCFMVNAWEISRWCERNIQ